jgi:ACS family glucarate transporter-like MFS transporter
VTAASIPAAAPTRVRYVVLAALCLVTLINYVQRNCIGAAETTVRADLGLTMQETGQAISVFFVAYALGQVPSGWFAQTWGPRLALTLFTVGWSVAIGVAAFAHDLLTLVGARLAMGALQAGIFPCTTLIVAAWLPRSRRALASGLLNSFMLGGGAVAAMLTGVLLGPLGWRWLFGLYALPGLAWAVAFALWFRNRPADHPGVNNAELALITGRPPDDKPLKSLSSPDHDAPPPLSLQSERTPWLAIFTSPAMLCICVQQFFRAGASRFYDSWLPTYLQEARGGTVLEAGMLSSWPQWGGVLGSLLGGWVSDLVLVSTGSRRAGRQGVAIGGLVSGTLCFVLAYQASEVRLAALLLSLGAFLTMAAAPCAYALTIDMGGKHVAVVFAVMNMSGNLGAFAFTWGVPQVRAWTGGWDAVLYVFAGIHLAAAGCWLFLNPRGTVFDRSATD